MPKKNLTARQVAALEPIDGKQTDYFDGNTRGLALRVSQNRARTWFLVYWAETSNGRKKRRYKLGRFPEMSLAQARAEAMRVKADLPKGVDPAAEKKKAPQIMTVAAMAEVYLEKHAKVNKRSWKKDEAILAQDILPVIGDLHPKEVERAHIEAILDKVAKRGTSTQQNRVFEIARGLFNWATGLYVDVPPTFAMKKRVKEQSHQRSLSQEEVRKLWHGLSQRYTASNGHPGIITELIAIVLKLLLVTGLRSSQVTQAKKGEIDRAGRMWSVPADEGRSKSGYLHRLPLSDLALELIDRAWELSLDSEYLFPSFKANTRGGPLQAPISTTAHNSGLAKLSALVGVPDVRPHDFREVVGTEMMALGIPEQHIGAVLSHVRTSVTAKHYARHAFEQEKREALDKWAVKLREIVGEARKPKPVTPSAKMPTDKTQGDLFG